MAEKKKKVHKKKPVQIQEDVSPNLIPMIDIMFLLLLFLMLGADMGQREFEEVTLPIVDASSVKEDKIRDHAGVTTINVYHKFDGKCQPFEEGGICLVREHWRIGVRGEDYDTKSIGTVIANEAKEGRAKDATGPSERKVMIRADQGALYEYVQKVIEACAISGLYKIEIGAAAKV